MNIRMTDADMTHIGFIQAYFARLPIRAEIAPAEAVRIALRETTEKIVKETGVPMQPPTGKIQIPGARAA